MLCTVKTAVDVTTVKVCAREHDKGRYKWRENTNREHTLTLYRGRRSSLCENESDVVGKWILQKVINSES